MVWRVVRHVKYHNPSADILIIHFVDSDKMKDYRAGHVPEVIGNYERVANHYGLPSLNLAREVTDRIAAGEFTWEEDFKDLHPSPFGQGIYARSIIRFLEEAWVLAQPRSTVTAISALPEKLHPWAYDAGRLEEVR